MTDQEFHAVSALTATARYEYLIKRVADSEEIWSLRNSEGWVMSGDDNGRELFPVWSHPRFASVVAVDEWADCAPEAIPLDAWRERWLPGLEQEGRLIAVFPVPKLTGTPVTPARFREDLELELENYE